MLTYPMDHTAGAPLYVALYRNIKADILAGRLHPDEKLPSKRGLARHLELSVVTVENAYAQLTAEGYIRSAERRGYFVCPVGRPMTAARPASRHVPEKAAHTYDVDLSSGGIGAAPFPFSVWAKLMRQVLSEQGRRLLEAAPPGGAAPLREAIADYLYHYRGIRADAEQLIVGAGAEYLYNLVVQLLGRDSLFAVEDPGYSKISHIYEANHVKCAYVGLDEEGLSMSALRRSGASVVHISPSHHYPTGIVTPIARRRELLSWACEAEGRYILEDDYDSEFRLTGRPIQTLQSIDENEKVLYLNTFSKSIAPSMRIGYMVLPPHLLERFRRTLGFYACTVPSFEQYTLARFIAGGAFEQHINRTRIFYRAQRDKIIAMLQQSTLRNRLTVLEKDSGLHFLLRVQTERSDRELAALAARAGIRVPFLSGYLHTPDSRFDHIAVINYAAIDTERLSDALARLGNILTGEGGTSPVMKVEKE